MDCVEYRIALCKILGAHCGRHGHNNYSVEDGTMAKGNNASKKEVKKPKKEVAKPAAKKK